MSLLRISNSFRNWMIVWGMLIVGHVAGLLLYCGLPTAYESVWLMVMLPISAIAFAAIGPLSIVLFFLTLFRVQGGTTTAIFSLVCGVPLLCWALFVLVRKMMKAKHRLPQWLLRVALACYSALSTFALLYVSSHGQKLALRSLVVLFDDGTGLPPLLRSAARGGGRPRRGAAKRRARDPCGTA